MQCRAVQSSAVDLQSTAVNLQRSAIDLQCSAVDLQCSAVNLRHGEAGNELTVSQFFTVSKVVCWPSMDGQ